MVVIYSDLIVEAKNRLQLKAIIKRILVDSSFQISEEARKVQDVLLTKANKRLQKLYVEEILSSKSRKQLLGLVREISDDGIVGKKRELLAILQLRGRKLKN
ncbi:MAG: hypothetical protein AABX05_05020 [Nanoarchaeota archaeon]